MLRVRRSLWMLLVALGSVTATAAEAETKPAAKPVPLSLSANALDALVVKHREGGPAGARLNDELFLRRVSLDLIGRAPTPDELQTFLDDKGADKRAKVIDRLLESAEFGTNWANYFSDAIRYRVPPPELTFLQYGPFKKWLAEKLNADVAWDQITQEILTASGKLSDVPQGMFIGFHQGRPENLAAETARVFLGLQLQCAQCHDHKFDHWKREQFHSLAAYFARTEAKLTQNSPFGTTIKDKGKGDYVMPDVENPKKKGTVMQPVTLSGQPGDNTAGDVERRTQLAQWVTSPTNPWFAKAFVNRIWGRLLGRGFYEPVDNMTDVNPPQLPAVHEALSKSFAESGYNIKGLFRVIVNTELYQRQLESNTESKPFTTATPVKLRGDEIFTSLEQAIGLPNVSPPPMKASAAVRFPPPPKSTRDIVCDCYGYDPSLPLSEISRTMPQAMLLMNNTQIQAQINADPESGTLLGKLLASESDNTRAVEKLFQQVLGRHPTKKESTIALAHLREVGERGPAFEDLLWSLINSTEFTTKR